MQYRRLGRAGVQLSVVGVGTNRFGSAGVDLKEVQRIVDCAADLGINHLDTADSYQHGASEAALGKVLSGRRQKFFLASKFHFATGDGPNDGGNSRYHIMDAVEASLRRLQSDHIDLYYVHRWDDNTPLDETLRALDDLIREGKVRYLGVSDFACWQLEKTNRLSLANNWNAVVALQSHYNMLARDVEAKILPLSRRLNLGFVPYFPLAGGFLTGKYKANQPAPPGSRGETSLYVKQYMTGTNYTYLAALDVWCQERGRTLSELALAWLLARPGVCSVISGATSHKHIEQNATASSWVLTAEELRAISAMHIEANP